MLKDPSLVTRFDDLGAPAESMRFDELPGGNDNMPMNAPATTTSTPTPPKRDDPAQPVVTNGDAIDPEGLSLVTKAQMEWHERDAKQRHGLTLAPKPVKRTDAGDDEALDEVTKAQRDWHARVYPGPGDAA